MNGQRLWLGVALLAGVSFAVQVALPVDLSDRPETTFDSAPRGHAALFELLGRFESTRGRWLTGLEMPPVDEPIWWIAPGGACEGGAGEEGDGSDAPHDEDGERGTVPLEGPFRSQVRPWIESGGTAVVWLSHPPLEAAPAVEVSKEVSGEGEGETGSEIEETDPESVREGWRRSLGGVREGLREGQAEHCPGLVGLPLPPRRLVGLEGGAPPVEGRHAPVVFSIGRAADRPDEFDYGATRTIPGPTLGFFDPAAAPLASSAPDPLLGWRPLWVESDDRLPFVLEHRLGEGRIVVVADARVVTNHRLARGDAAPFVFDQVEAFGRPWVDEHAHGVVPESGTFRYLAQSPAWASGLGLVILGLLYAWRGQAWPQRAVSEVDPDAPTLTDFVESVAGLYAETRDHEHVFERYRAVCLDRVRRALGLAPGTSNEIVLASLRSRASNWPELREAGLGSLLTKRIPIESAGELTRNAARLDDLVRLLRRTRPGAALGGESDEARDDTRERGAR